MPKIQTDERLALNLFDLDSIVPELKMRLFRGRLDLRRDSVIRVDKDKTDETAVPLLGDLLSAAVACDILRSENRREGDKVVRVYLNRGTNWVKLPASAILTDRIEGELILNSEIFPSARALLPEKPLAVKAVRW